MPVLIRYEFCPESGEHLFKPVAVCDHCRKPVTYAAGGNYHWDLAAVDGNDSAVFVTHKACCRAFEAQRPEVNWGAESLSLLPAYLARNVGLDLPPAKPKANRK